MAIQHNTRQIAQAVIEPCPFRIGDLVRVKEFTIEEDGNVGTVVADHQIVRVDMDQWADEINHRREMGTLMHFDYDKFMAIVRQPVALVTWWCEPGVTYPYPYGMLEKVET